MPRGKTGRPDKISISEEDSLHINSTDLILFAILASGEGDHWFEKEGVEEVKAVTELAAHWLAYIDGWMTPGDIVRWSIGRPLATHSRSRSRY